MGDKLYVVAVVVVLVVVVVVIASIGSQKKLADNTNKKKIAEKDRSSFARYTPCIGINWSEAYD